MSDPMLENVRCKADSGVVTKSRELNRGKTRVINRRDLLYRQFKQGNKTSAYCPEQFSRKGFETGS